MRHILLIAFLLLLTGCWDQRLVEEIQIFFAIGYDREGDLIMTTVSGPTGVGQEAGQFVVITTTSQLPRLSRSHITRREARPAVGGQLRAALISRELAEEGIGGLLDSFLRDPANPANIWMVIINGRAQEAFHLDNPAHPSPGIYVDQLVRVNQQQGNSAGVTFQQYQNRLMAPGLDPFLPLVIVGTTDLELEGTALFNHDRMTGVLDENLTSILLYLSGQSRAGEIGLTHTYAQEDQYAVISVVNAKSQIQILPGPPLRYQISLELTADLMGQGPRTGIKPDDLENGLSQDVTDRMQAVMRELQQANCDALGLGLRLRAYHNHIWSSLDWRETYPTLPIEVKGTVRIRSEGLLHSD